jgi:membrane protein implicated in regulation of membrane protease activity
VQSNLEQAEVVMRTLANSLIDEDMDRFTQLIKFRKFVGQYYADLRRSYIYNMTCLGSRPPVFLLGPEPGSNSKADNAGRRAKSKSAGIETPSEKGKENLNTIRERQAVLEKRLDAIKEDLNEEIQVTVGTVQVHDAQVMKEQAAVTARQTTWTVALTVLAAVYLPMTLVTGIFGMNITEISSEATAPNAWWAVVGILTVTGISLYVIVRKLRARKKEDDSEAMEEYELEVREAGPEQDKWQNEGTVKWGRAKQMVKAIWSRKRE